jgi:hypothetical protein
LALVVGPRAARGPLGWHQSGAPTALVIGGVVPSNTFSWAATPRSVFDMTKPLPRDGIYVWVLLRRPEHGPTGAPLRLSLRLHDARLIDQEGAKPGLPEYRFDGRYRDQYEVSVGVEFGRARPPLRLRARAERVLRALGLPRWVPFSRRTRC